MLMLEAFTLTLNDEALPVFRFHAGGNAAAESATQLSRASPWLSPLPVQLLILFQFATSMFNLHVFLIIMRPPLWRFCIMIITLTSVGGTLNIVAREVRFQVNDVPIPTINIVVVVVVVVVWQLAKYLNTTPPEKCWRTQHRVCNPVRNLPPSFSHFGPTAPA